MSSPAHLIAPGVALVLVATVAAAGSLAGPSASRIAAADAARADTTIATPTPAPRPDAADRPRAQLRRLAALQDLCFMSAGTYCDQATLAATERYAGPARVQSRSATGWSATVVVPRGERPMRCGIFVGDAPPPHPAVTVEREPACW